MLVKIQERKVAELSNCRFLILLEIESVWVADARKGDCYDTFRLSSGLVIFY